MSNQNKSALITGSSRGIGKATAIAFAKSGYNLYLTCEKSIDALYQLARQLEKEYHITCTAVQVDMGDFLDVKELFADIEELDVLVNNAGICHSGLLADMSPEQWHRVQAVNLDSCFYTSKFAIPLMLKKHSGKIINVSSVWGAQGASMEVAYSASKGAVNTFTKALARELAPSNIQVNAVAPGVIDTDMNAGYTDDERAVLIDEIPANRMGTPEEVAAMILQIATAPEYMTGQVITVDGGWC